LGLGLFKFLPVGYGQQEKDSLLMLPVPDPRAMLADRGHDSDCLRQALLIQRILPFIPSRIGRKAHQQTDWQRYRDRNRIERMFNRLRQMRRIATRYDKTALSFMSFLNLAAARHWIKSLINVTLTSAFGYQRLFRYPDFSKLSRTCDVLYIKMFRYFNVIVL